MPAADDSRPARLPPFITDGRGQKFIMDRLQRNLLHIPSEDHSHNSLIFNILDFINRMREMGENFGINQLPQTDIENTDTMITTITKTIDQLKNTGKDKQALVGSYMTRLDNIKREHTQYSNMREDKIRQYNRILSDLTELRATLGSHIPSHIEVQDAKRKLDAQKKTLASIDRELSNLNLKRESIETSARQLKTQVMRDVAAGLGGPEIPTLK